MNYKVVSALSVALLFIAVTVLLRNNSLHHARTLHRVPVKNGKLSTWRSCYTVFWNRLVAYSTVGGTPVFGRRTDSVLRSACSLRVTTMWVNRPIQVSQLGQLSLRSFRGR